MFEEREVMVWFTFLKDNNGCCFESVLESTKGGDKPRDCSSDSSEIMVVVAVGW